MVHDFHQTNYLSTIGSFVGVLIAVFIGYIGFDDLLHPTKDTKIMVIVMNNERAGRIPCAVLRLHPTREG